MDFPNSSWNIMFVIILASPCNQQEISNSKMRYEEAIHLYYYSLSSLDFSTYLPATILNYLSLKNTSQYLSLASIRWWSVSSVIENLAKSVKYLSVTWSTVATFYETTAMAISYRRIYEDSFNISVDEETLLMTHCLATDMWNRWCALMRFFSIYKV